MLIRFLQQIIIVTYFTCSFGLVASKKQIASQTLGKTTVMNLKGNSSHLSHEEISFFDEMWMRSYNDIVQSNQQESTANHTFIVTNISIIQASLKLMKKVDDSNISGGKNVRRKLKKTKKRRIYDARVLIDWSCKLCWNYDWDRRQLGRLSRTIAKKEKFNKMPLEGILSKQSHGRFEEIFCDSLRNGRFSVFKEVRNCRILLG
jgi:hypothetical protein